MKTKAPAADRKPAEPAMTSEDVYKERYIGLMEDAGDTIATVLLSGVGQIAGDLENRRPDLDPDRMGRFVAAVARAKAAIDEAEWIASRQYTDDGE